MPEQSTNTPSPAAWRWRVTDAIALGVPDPYHGQRLVAVVASDAEDVVSEASILEVCGDRRPRHKLPRDLYRVRSWPMTSSGKVVRGQVEAWVLDGDPALEALDG